MDTNGSMGGFPFTSLPMGFSMALAMNEPALRGYAELSETEREHIIMKCKDARTKEEMRQIVDSLVPEGNVNHLYEHRDTTAEG